MSDRKEQLERTGPISVEVGADESYGIGWKSDIRPTENILVPDRTPRSEITMEIMLGDCVIEGVQHKRLYVCISSDGAIAECKDDEPVSAFRDDEHAIRWVQNMIAYLDRHLPERLRTMTSLTVVEAIAKSSEAHGIAKTDWKELAERHARIVELKIKESLGVHSGPARFFETKQQYLNFLADAARASRTAGKGFTQEWVAKFASKRFSYERPFDERTVRQWNEDYHVNWKQFAAKVNRRN
jgi:hypothetical protein